MGNREVILVTAMLFCFAVVVFRLGDRMLLNHDAFVKRARSQQVKKADIQVRRGPIYDRMGRELAVNLEVESLYCRPSKVEDPKGASSDVARLTGESYKNVLKKVSSDDSFVWIQRKLDLDKARKLKDEKLAGFGFIPDAKRLYPKGKLAAHIIGCAGIDNQALEGVELEYDSTLSNKGGMLYIPRDASGKTLSDGVEFESKGNGLVLSIDEGIQYIMEKELDEAWHKWKAESASAVMMDPYTGEILAMANRPTYDLNNFGGSKGRQRRNRVITDTFEPGSTFKLVVGLAALEEGVFSPSSKFDASKGYIEVAGYKIHDTSNHGVMTFTEVMQKSSNVGAVMIGEELGPDRVYEYAKKLGFGEKTGIDLPGEVQGRIPDPETWSATSIGAVPIGYEVSVSMMQILRAYAVVANGGFLVTPHVVTEILSPEGHTISSFRVERERVISEHTARTFRDVLKTVTSEGGTAPAAAVDGNGVAGKTGTTKQIDPETGRYSSVDYTSSFVGFVPADKPRFVMMVVVNKPRGQVYGGAVAAPVFSAISEKVLSYLNVPLEHDKDSRVMMVDNKKSEVVETH